MMNTFLENLNVDKILTGIDRLRHMKIDKNVGNTERIISTLAGTLLVLHGMKKGKKFSEMSLGSFLLFRGATGYCPVTEAIAKKGAGAHQENINMPHLEAKSKDGSS